MLLRVEPGSTVRGVVSVPGDKSVAHRLLILAATATGASTLEGLPSSLDLRSTAGCLRHLVPHLAPQLEGWLGASRVDGGPEGGGQREVDAAGGRRGRGGGPSTLHLDGRGRVALAAPEVALDCGNSATTMRLVAGLLAGARLDAVLTGDRSLLDRPMERVAEPLRLMGADVRTREGRPPVAIRGGELRGIRYALPVPSAQVKGAVLLAGLAAEGETTVEEHVPTRDHTERLLEALGAPVRRSGDPAAYPGDPASWRGDVSVRPFGHGGFRASVPGDPSSAAFLAAAAAVTGGEVEV
ncbi:MAG: hypothetical protein HY658_08265, partial [Actinobacteria bacterium]|nr:hypothetical protein [Actinomycetota bacterium]